MPKNCAIPTMENAQMDGYPWVGEKYSLPLFDKSIQKIQKNQTYHIVYACQSNKLLTSFGCVYKVPSLYSLCKCSRKPKRDPVSVCPLSFSSTLHFSRALYPAKEKKNKNKKRKAENVLPTLRLALIK